MSRVGRGIPSQGVLLGVAQPTAQHLGQPDLRGIQFDAASSSGYEPALSTYSWNHTCSGTNRGLLVNVSIFATGSVTGITYNGVALRFVRADANGVYRNEIWALENPAAGTNAIVVTLSTSLTSIGSAASYTGVDQTNMVDANNGANGLGGTPSASVTTVASYDWVVSGISTADTTTAPAAGERQRANNTGALGSGGMSDEGPVFPAGSDTMSWAAVGVTDSWALSLVALLPFTPAAPVAPTLAQQTIQVKTATATQRAAASPRYAPSSRLIPPAVVEPSLLPPDRRLTILARLAAVSRRAASQQRQPRSRLQPPNALQTFSGPRIRLATIRPRPTSKRLQPPFFYPASSVIDTTLVAIRVRLAARNRETLNLLRPPAVLQVFDTGRASLVAVRVRLDRLRRIPRSRLAPPQFYPATSPIRVVSVAVRARIERVRRAPHSELLPPAALQTFQGPSVALAGRTRIEAVRRAPRSFLTDVPLNVLPPVDLTILTVDVAVDRAVASQRRAPYSRLNPPTALAVFDAAKPHLARIRPARTVARLSRPVILPARSTIQVTLAARRTRVEAQRRAAHSKLQAPQTLNVFSGPRVALARAKRAVARSRLNPAVTPAAVSIAPPVRVTLARPPRPTPRSFLTDVPVETPGPVDLTILTVTAAAQPRPALHSRLFPPVIAAAQPLARPLLSRLARVARPKARSRLAPPASLGARSAIRVTLAARRPRRATRLRIAPPTALRVFFGPKVIPARTAPRRNTRSRLGTPQTLRTFAGPLATLARNARRLLSRSRLGAPAAAPTLAEPLEVALAPAQPRRGVLSRLYRPVVVLPFVPPLAPPIRVVTVAVAVRVALLRRAPHSTLHPPGPTRAKGVACLIDVPAAIACLTDAPAMLTCLEDLLAAEACLEDAAATDACLVDQSAATATLRSEEE